MIKYIQKSFLIFLSFCILQPMCAMENNNQANIQPNFEVVKYLPGSPLEKKNPYGNTAFHVLAKNDKSEAEIRKLLTSPHFDFQNKQAQNKTRELYLILKAYIPKELIFKTFEVLSVESPEDYFFTGLCKHLVKNNLERPLIIQTKKHETSIEKVLQIRNQPGSTAAELLQKSVRNPQYVAKVKPLLTGQRPKEDLKLFLTSSNLSDDNLANETYNNYSILFEK